MSDPTTTPDLPAPTQPEKAVWDAEAEQWVELQPPPFTKLRSHLPLRGVEVEIRLIDGHIVRGRLVAFILAGDSVEILPDGAAGVPISYPVTGFKYLRVQNPYRIADYAAEGRTALQNLNPTEQLRQFTLQFTDQEALQGYTLGSRVSHNGVHLYMLPAGFDPQQHKIETCNHFFVSKATLLHYSIGKLLGRLLVEGKQITQEALDHTLADMQQRRSARIGDYLVSQKVVDAEALELAIERQKKIPRLKLGEILLTEGLLTESQLELALREQKRKQNAPLGQILIEKGFLTKDQLQQYLAKKLGIPFVNLKEYIIEPGLLELFPAALAYKYNAVPLLLHEGRLVVAVENPLDWEMLNELRFSSGHAIDPAIGSESEITWALQFYYSTEDVSLSYSSLDEAVPDQEREAIVFSESLEIRESVVVKVVNKMITDAYFQKASDIHIEPGSDVDKVVVRFRKDGILSQYYRFPAKFKSVFVTRLKVMANLDIANRFLPQDGKIDFRKHSKLELELRIATIPTNSGVEDVVIRLLAPSKALPLRGLGLGTPHLDNVLDLVSRPQGLFLVCGPTGSGKTTTLHSVLSHLNTPEKKIWTVEDPVEITQLGLRQVSINNKVGLSYDKVMRALLRADPDIIMVGEIRDTETAGIAIEASLTGHLVLSTLHTNGAAETVARLLDMGIDPFNFSDALLGILSQRLVRTLCVSCKSPYAPGDDEVERLAIEYLYDSACGEQVTRAMITTQVEQWREAHFGGKDIVLFRPTGCKECMGSGYRGRIGVYELLVTSAELQRMILHKCNAKELQQAALEEGMQTRKQDGIEKVLKGLTEYTQVRML